MMLGFLKVGLHVSTHHTLQRKRSRDLEPPKRHPSIIDSSAWASSGFSTFLHLSP